MDTKTSEIILNKTKKCQRSKIIFFVSIIMILTVYYNYKYLNYSTKTSVKMKYILKWTNASYKPFIYMGKSQNVFLLNKCLINNCYVTSSIEKHKITDFDAVLFHGPELDSINLPLKRSPHQIYIFVSMESSHYYPIYDEKFDNFFNWTWTYKLNSDIYFGYIIIRDIEGNVIGPKKDMHWLKAEEMMPIDDTLISKLKQKNSAVAWLVSNCKTRSQREKYSKELKHELQKYNMTLDIYGKCGKKCVDDMSESSCINLIRKYYFYLSFENSYSEDYVTEKLLTALLNYAVPVVYGEANYTRFLPDGAYLNAKRTTVKELAKIIFDAIENKTKYYDFFRWRNHYSYHNVDENSETNYYCRLCSKLNENVIGVKTYQNFDLWWNN